MKKLKLVLFLLFLLPLLSTGQSFNQTNANGQKQGKWSKTYANGVPRYEGQFNNDQPYGEFKHYYRSGIIQAITTYSPDGVIARTKTFHENSKLMAEGKYINQKKDSIWRYYSDVDENLISDESYNNGQLNGLSRTYYPESGNIAQSIEYIDGIKNGLFRKYFPEGSIMTKGTYINDLLNGDFTLYFPEGKVQLKGKYMKGRQMGNWQYFDEEGNEISEDDFKDSDNEVIEIIEE